MQSRAVPLHTELLISQVSFAFFPGLLQQQSCRQALVLWEILLTVLSLS